MSIPPTEVSLCRAVGARASADARTVYRILHGGRPRGLVGGRILHALREMGIEVQPSGSPRLKVVEDRS